MKQIVPTYQMFINESKQNIKENEKDNAIESMIDDIIKDFKSDIYTDVSAIFELLMLIQHKNLVAFLPENYKLKEKDFNFNYFEEDYKPSRKEILVANVIDYIRKDINDGDVSALFELLSTLKEKQIKSYLDI